MHVFFRGFRKPLTHFLLIGGMLFVLQWAWQKYREPSVVFVQQDLLISKGQIEQLKKDVLLQSGLPPTSEHVEHLVQLAIDDEVLYREALALKLDQNNPSIRRRLIDLAKLSEDKKTSSKSEDALYKKSIDLGLDRYDPVVRRMLIATMRLIAKKVPTRNAPASVNAQEIETYFQAHADSFKIPAQITFTHLYFSRDKRGEKAKYAAARVLKTLGSQGATSQILPESLKDRGDVFLRGARFSGMTPTTLEKTFGSEFARVSDQFVQGEWSGPFASSYGWHVIFVEALRPERPATRSDVAHHIKKIILEEREAIRLAETIQKLRSRYRIVIEKDEVPHA